MNNTPKETTNHSVLTKTDYGGALIKILYRALAAVILLAMEMVAQPLPVADFTANFCNFPQAWEMGTGKGITIYLLSGEESFSKTEGKLLSLAPNAIVKDIDYKDLNTIPKEKTILLVNEEPNSKEQEELISFLDVEESNSSVILSAYYGEYEKEKKGWNEFVKKIHKAGAIIVGTHGRAYQIGNLEKWKEVPVDLFAINEMIDGDRGFDPEAKFRGDLSAGATVVAAAVAIQREKEPNINVEDIRKRLAEGSRKISWINYEKRSGEEVWKRITPYYTKEKAREFYKGADSEKVTIIDEYENVSLNAALLLGLELYPCGEWNRKVIEADVANKKATGKGITVAILDHLFDKEDSVFAGRLVAPGSVVAGEAVFSEKGHGTWMANHLVQIAPDVNIMPVRFCGKGHYGEAEYYLKGIKYAIENGADIITISHRAIEKEREVWFDEQLAKLPLDKVQLIYIHYQGKNENVIVTKPIEFAPYYEGRKEINGRLLQKSCDYYYVIGTNYVNEDSFPYTWGLSQTAPIVGGVVAMMKEIKPTLITGEIKRILREAGRRIKDDYEIINAGKAVEMIK